MFSELTAPYMSCAVRSVQALQQSSAEVQESMGENIPPRAVSTPPVPGPRAVANDHAPSAMAADARVNSKVTVPKGVAKDFKILPQTALHPQVHMFIHQDLAASRPRSRVAQMHVLFRIVPV